MTKFLTLLVFLFSSRSFAVDLYDSSRTPMSEAPYGSVGELVRDKADLDKFIEKQKDAKTSALLVLKDGKLVIEKYWDIRPDEKVLLHSVTKSVLSLLVGKLIEDNRINPQDKAQKWLLDWGGDKAKITIENLLTQTSGLPAVEKENLKATDRIAMALREPLVSPPGAEFNYSNAGPYLLGEIILRDTKDRADIYGSRKLFEPLGISNWEWGRDLTQHVDTSGGLRLTARDLLKIGLMVSNQGKWNEKSIISSSYIAEATSRKGKESSNYGYLWWVRDNVFYARGDFGQILGVFPKKKLVIVRLRKTEDVSEKETPAGRWDQDLFELGRLFKK